MIHTQEHTQPKVDLLAEAGREFYQICAEVDDKYDEAGIEIDRVDPEEYWYAVVLKAHDVVEEKYSSIDTDFRKGAALELIASMPYHLLNRQRLNANESGARPLPRDERQRRVYYESYHNTLIRNYVIAAPETTTAELNASLTQVVKKSDVTQHPEAFRRMIARDIVGAQTELIGAQILSEIAEVRPATTEEDLQGMDVIMRTKGRYGVPIDLKASAQPILDKSDGASHILTVANGSIMLNAQLTDEDHYGKFYVEHDVARSKAATLAPRIREAMKNQSLRRVEF